jgi:hypothetical protein
VPAGRLPAKLGEAIHLSLRRCPIASEKRELVRAFAVGFERFAPERFRLLVRTTRVTRGTYAIAGTASVNDHRVVPHGEAVSKIACFTRPDGIGY